MSFFARVPTEIRDIKQILIVKRGRVLSLRAQGKRGVPAESVVVNTVNFEIGTKVDLAIERGKTRITCIPALGYQAIFAIITDTDVGQHATIRGIDSGII